MLTSGQNKKPLPTLLGFVSIALFLLGFSTSSIALAQTDTTTPTTINISDTIKTKNAQRLGVNLGTQDFWDSGMMMRNLAFRNPGFEAETWQSILHCQAVTSNSCTDDNQWTYWPANFLANGTASFISGANAGTIAAITSSTAATIGVVGVTVQMSGLSAAPAVGDYVVVRMNVPGNAGAGWWQQSYGGATFTTDTTDISPNSPGKQALSMNASGAGQQAVLCNYDDGIPGKIFIKMNGNYTVSFRAKGTGGSNQVTISANRTVTTPPAVNFFSKTVNLSNTWQDYSFTFPITNDVNRPGSVQLSFNAYQSSLLIDDVAFTEAAGANNPTVYRNSVLSALQTLHPGTIRYMDSGINWGSSFDNLIAPDFARLRTGYSNHDAEIDDIPMSLHDFLVLCQAVGADPWFTMPTGMTTQEMSNMMDYFGGSSSTVYGAKRAALGQSAPWTTVFGQIHLEFGNEVWNTGNPGANMTDAAAYGKRAGVIFTTAKASASYAAKSFDFVLGGFAAVPYWTQTALANSTNYDTIDTASYNFGSFNDASSTEAIFGPMFAEPEYYNDSPAGLTNEAAVVAATAGSKPAGLAVYETNMGTIVGSATQAQVEDAVPSLGAGLAVGLNMLLAQRDLGVTTQNMFALEGYTAPYTSSVANGATTSPIWGVTVDMGGPTNLRRPMYLSEELANTAILPSLLSTTQAGSNPTWNQAYTQNQFFSLPNAHYIQSFSYTDGTTLNIILFNLSRTSALPVNFAGLNAPIGTATKSTLTASTIDANNETQQNVAITSTSQQLTAGGVLSLPPFSMTVLSLPAPVVPIEVYGVTDTCANTSLSAYGTTTCTATVTGQGKYNNGVTWSAVAGSVSNDGVYTAPATYPANLKDVITATSVGNTTKSASFTISIAPNTITGVTASCPVSTVDQGKTVTCKAVVTGTGGFTSSYTWSTTGGTITPDGSLTAPATGTSVTLTATSTQDTTKSGSVTIKLTPVLVIGPVSASVAGTSATVKWTINMPANSAIAYGTTPAMELSTPYNQSTSQTPSITLSGLQPSTTYYMQPYSFSGNQVASQYSTFTTSSSATTVTGVSVGCSAVSLLLGASTGCSSTVTGTGSYSSAVTWTTSLGSISPTGVLTAPSSLLGSTITVTATSIEDTTKFGSVSIALNPPPTVTAVSLACQATTITEGSSTTCTPTVTGTGNITKAVTFSATAGTVTSSGVLTAPSTGNSVTVTATSVQDSTKSASTVISLTPLPTITGVTVTCQASSLFVSGSTTCGSAVAGTGSYTSAVTWSTSAGTITPSGALTAPASGTSVTVKATSTEDPTKSGVATITLQDNMVISNPVIVASTNSVTVSWTVNNAQAHSGVNYGTDGNWTGITSYDPNPTANPSYTIGGLPAGTPVNLNLFSFVGSQSVSLMVNTATKSAAATITSVAASCASSTLVAGKSESCSASVGGTGSYSSTVTWSISAGSITPAGVLTAPTTGNSVTIKATSVQDPTKSASTTVTLTPAPTVSSVTMSCPVNAMPVNRSTTCIASVTGTGSYTSAVTWSTTGGSVAGSASAGTIANTGLVTAPSTVSTITVTATSTEDPTKSASTDIAIKENLAIVNPVFSATPTTIVVSWDVTDYSYSGVVYRGESGDRRRQTPRTTVLAKHASFTLTDLAPGVTYDVEVYSVDMWGPVSQSLTITTPLQ